MSRGYADSASHLRDELAKVELLVRAHFARWRAAIAQHKPPQSWGVPHVSTAEIDSFLSVPFSPAEESTDPPEAQRYIDCFEQQQEQILRRLDATADTNSMRLCRLARAFELDATDTAILLTCLLPQFEPRYRRLYGYLLDDASRTRPTAELLWWIVRPMLPSPEEFWNRYSPESPLLRHRLISIARYTREPFPEREVWLDDWVAGFLMGVDNIDTRIRHCVTEELERVQWDDLFVGNQLRARLQQLASLCREGTQALLHFQGADPLCCTQAASAIAFDTGMPLFHIDCEAALRGSVAFREVAELVCREVRLRRAVPYFDRVDALLTPEIKPDHWRVLLELAGRYDGVTVFRSEAAMECCDTDPEYEILRFSFPAPDVTMRAQLWQRELQKRLHPVPFNSEWPQRLATAFELGHGQIRNAVHGALALAVQRDVASPQLLLSDLQESCRRQSGQRLGSLAQRIEPRRELSMRNLILPDANMQQLIELRDCIRYQHEMAFFGLDRFSAGKGIVALFAGASGTGKTMSAELIALDRGVDLCKVDLSALVSKWVGETPKNLNRLFQEAEGCNAILFFDEADSVFGKRSRISSPQDRWANLEVNYLLQRIESYSGVVILATNLKENIDEAFLRRIHRTVDFPFPDVTSRFRIWSSMLPCGRHELTEEQLYEVAAKFELTGGSIRNAVMDSAVRALASNSTVIRTRHVVVSVARELQKLGRPVTRSEFGLDFYDWASRDILSPVVRETAVGA